MPEVTDLMRVAQYVKSDRDAPSDVYNAACRVLDEQEAMRCGAEKLLNMSIDLGRQLGHAEACVNVLEAERDALRAKVSRLQAERIEREAVRKATQGHRDGRTPQTLGASEGQAATEAQEARE